MTYKITPGKGGQCLFALKQARFRNPLIKQGKGLLFTLTRPQTNESLLSPITQKVHSAQFASRSYPSLCQCLIHFLAHQLLAALQCFCKHFTCSCKDFVSKSSFA